MLKNGEKISKNEAKKQMEKKEERKARRFRISNHVSRFKQYRLMLRHIRKINTALYDAADAEMVYRRGVFADYHQLRKKFKRKLKLRRKPKLKPKQKLKRYAFFTPAECALNTYLLNLQSLLVALEEGPYELREQALRLLLIFVTDGLLLNGPASCCTDEIIRAPERAQQRRDIMKECIEFLQPLPKVADIFRSYRTKPYSEKPLAEAAFIDRADECDEVVKMLADIYIDFHGLQKRTEAKEHVKTDILRMLRASVVHAPQFTILPYYLTIMFLQEDWRGKPSSLDQNDTLLYQTRMKKQTLKRYTQEQCLTLFFQIWRVVERHRFTIPLSQKELKEITAEKDVAKLVASESIFSAAVIAYIPSKHLAACLSKNFDLTQEDAAWVRARWEELFYYRDSTGKQTNKKAVITCLQDHPIGKVLSDLNMVLQPKNHIRILTRLPLDAESKKALERLYQSITVPTTAAQYADDMSDAANTNVPASRMYAAVKTKFGVRTQDISLLVFRMECNFSLIDETELDPFEESLVDGLHKTLKNMIKGFSQYSYLNENWSCNITAGARVRMMELQSVLLKNEWNKSLLIDFCKKVDITHNLFQENFLSFLHDAFPDKKLNDFWKWYETAGERVHDFVIAEAFQTVMLQVETYFVSSIMSILWKLMQEGGFPI